MATQVYLVKRTMSERRKNGQKKTRWSLRWEDPDSGKWKCEATKTADRTEAEALRREKWAEVNGLTPPKPAPVTVTVGPSWADCGEQLREAMRTDNRRGGYIADAVLTLDVLRRAHPECQSPADITPKMANDYKKALSQGRSSWSVRSDLATLKAIFGKWLMKECGLLSSNPFANVAPPKCDEPDVRIVTNDESEALMAWLAARWNNWRLPLVYLEVAAIVGWRATEIASIRAEDILPDGFVRVAAEFSKTRKTKIGKTPGYLHEELRRCSAEGWAFGRFADDLRRLLMLWKRQPNHAARVQDFAPHRLVAWLQDELQRFNAQRQQAAKDAGEPVPEGFTLHDFRRTAITAMQMAGASEKDVSLQVGATPEIIRRHYEKFDQMTIARRNLERRFGDHTVQPHSVLRAVCARTENDGLDRDEETPEAITA